MTEAEYTRIKLRLALLGRERVAVLERLRSAKTVLGDAQAAVNAVRDETRNLDDERCSLLKLLDDGFDFGNAAAKGEKNEH